MQKKWIKWSRGVLITQSKITNGIDGTINSIFLGWKWRFWTLIEVMTFFQKITIFWKQKIWKSDPLFFLHRRNLAPSPNCECGASEQTADHVLTLSPIHRAPHGAQGLTVLDDETRCWLNNITASIWSRQCSSLG